MVLTDDPAWSNSPLAYPSFHKLILSVTEAKRSGEIYEASLTCLRETLGVEQSSILLLDDDGVMRFCAWRNLSDAYRDAVEGHSPWSRDTVDPEPVLVQDVREDASLGSLAPVIEAEGIRALAFVPLTIAGRLLGKFMLHYPDVHNFSAVEIETVRAVAANVAFAIDQHEKREHLEATSHSTIVGIAELDPRGRFREVNERFCNLAGRSREELLSLSCYDITHADDQRSTREQINALVRGAAHFELDKRILRPDGQTVWLTSGVSALRDEDGSLRGMIMVTLDVTNRQIAQEELAQSEGRYRELVGALGLAVYTTDSEGRILLFNDAAVQLWGRRPRIGKDLWCGSWRMFTPDGDPMPLDECPMALALREQRPVRDQEIVVERPDGTKAHVLPFPTPLWDDKGHLAGAVNVLVDITERKRAEAEAAQAYMLKDQFLSLVSHELRSPISTILGNALLLAKRSDLLTDDNKQRAYADIVSQTRKLHESIENLLLLTRLESASIEFDAVSLSHVALAAADVFHDVYPDRSVTFDFQKVPPALGQETLIELVLKNLLANAAKYSPPETEIEVRIGVSPAGLPEVRVRDRGIGLADVDMASLFTAFYRSQAARDCASGMGLGLAVCRRVIEVQKGTIGAEPREGGGSDFYFTLQEATE